MEGQQPSERGPAVRTPLSAPDTPNSPALPTPPSSPTGDQPPPAAPSPRGPVRVPDHALLRLIGHGAYGEVWLARSALGTPRAVKVVRLADFPDPAPFDREFRGIQKYEPISRSHPGLIDILQVGRSEAEGCFYYVMELADPAADPPIVPLDDPGPSTTPQGSAIPTPPALRPHGPVETLGDWPDYAPRTLRHELKTRGRLPVADCLEVGLAMAGAIEYLHRAGLVHRDIKPSNIVFVAGRAKLADVGLIADLGDTHSIVGTDGYLPPEGAGTPEADVYSLGKVLYEMSTGLDRRRFPELPSDSADPADRVALRELNEIVLQACARDPAHRYPTAAALRKDLQRLRQGGSIRRRRAWERARRGARRILPTLAVALVLGIMLLSPRRRPPAHPTPAAGPAASTERASVFVLPFRSSLPYPTAPAAIPGRVTDAFIDALASFEGVRRCPRRSSWLVCEESDLRASLARTNDMRHVLSGALEERSGTFMLRLRLSARHDDHLVWTEDFVADTNLIVELEFAALRRLAGVLGLPLTPADEERVGLLLRNNREAGRLVATGWQHYEQGAMVNATLTRIIALADEARRLDPLCLDAWFLRASVIRDFALLNRPPNEIWPDIEREALAMLREDDTRTDALNYMCAPTFYRDWDWEAGDLWAQRQLRWEMGASYHFIRALWLRNHGLFEAARIDQALSERPEPHDAVRGYFALSARWVNREYDDGIRLANRILEANPDAIWPYFWFAHHHVARGDFEEGLRAIDRFERVNPMPSVTALRGYAYARMGQPEKARAVLEQLRDQHRTHPSIQPYFIARIHAALGETDAALDWLQRAEEDRSEYLVFPDSGGGLRTDPAWDPFQDHPRFQALLKKVGLDRWPVPIHPLEE